MRTYHTKPGDVWKVHKKWFRRNAPDFWAEMKQRCDTLDRYAAEEKRLKAEKQAAKAA